MITSSAIRTYLLENRISLADISAHTGISKRKLHPKHTTAFNSTELCVLCSYLDISPEQFFWDDYLQKHPNTSFNL